MDNRLAKAVDLMIATLDEPMPVGAIADRIDISIWTLNRLFRRYLKQTPAAYYRQLRLAQAHNLQRNSNLRVSEISGMCGFENPESFARAYKRSYGKTASRDRN